jgi:hypothetical protein
LLRRCLAYFPFSVYAREVFGFLPKSETCVRAHDSVPALKGAATLCRHSVSDLKTDAPEVRHPRGPGNAERRGAVCDQIVGVEPSEATLSLSGRVRACQVERWVIAAQMV